jgi:hypothetical protein
MIPVLRQMGNSENARASLVSSVISPLHDQLPLDFTLPCKSTYIAAFKIAMFPLNSPLRHRAKHICQKVVLKPKATAEAAEPIQPCSSV